MTLVCSQLHLVDVVPLDRALPWSSAAHGNPQEATHRGTLALPLMATDGHTHVFHITGVYCSENARLNAVAPADLYRAGVTFRLHTNEPDNCVVIVGINGTQKQGEVIWIEQLPVLPTAALVQAHTHTTVRTPISPPVLRALPSHDYIHLVFENEVNVDRIHMTSPCIYRWL